MSPSKTSLQKHQQSSTLRPGPPLTRRRLWASPLWVPRASSPSISSEAPRAPDHRFTPKRVAWWQECEGLAISNPFFKVAHSCCFGFEVQKPSHGFKVKLSSALGCNLKASSVSCQHSKPRFSLAQTETDEGPQRLLFVYLNTLGTFRCAAAKANTKEERKALACVTFHCCTKRITASIEILSRSCKSKNNIQTIKCTT